MKEKNILITGAAGFIGAHLAGHLLQRGDRVMGFDNFNDYYDPALKQARVAANGAFDVVISDICNKEALSAAVDNFNPSHIVHLAAQAGVRYSLENPNAYVTSNIAGFLNVLEVCRERPSIFLTYASSSSVYGNSKNALFSEMDKTDSQESLYGVTKKTNELMAEAYQNLYGIAATGLRFFTVYGPWGRPDMAYYSFTKKILAGEPIFLYNNGLMMRDFTYIDDIVAGIAAAVDGQNRGAIFNLGNNSPVALGDFVATLEELLGKKAVIEYLPMQKGDVVATAADIAAAKRILGFKPSTPLRKGLEQFVNWYCNAAVQTKE